jgi:hypothetical protein
MFSLTRETCRSPKKGGDMRLTSFNPQTNQQLECFEFLEAFDDFFLDKSETRQAQTTRKARQADKRHSEETWDNSEWGLQWS